LVTGQAGAAVETEVAAPDKGTPPDDVVTKGGALLDAGSKILVPFAQRSELATALVDPAAHLGAAEGHPLLGLPLGGGIIETAGGAVEAILRRDDPRRTSLQEALLQIITGVLAALLALGVAEAIVDVAALLAKGDAAKVGLVPALALGHALGLIEVTARHDQIRAKIRAGLIRLGLAACVNLRVPFANLADELVATSTKDAAESLYIRGVTLTRPRAVLYIISRERARRTLLNDTLGLSPTEGLTRVA